MKRETQSAMITALGGITQVGARVSKAIDVAGFGEVKAAADVVAGAARSLRGIAEQLEGIAAALTENEAEKAEGNDDGPPTN